MNMTRLRLLTIVVPIVFVVALELFALFVLDPFLGSNATPRLLIIFALLALGVVPFSFAVFSVIERQQRGLEQSAAVLASVKDYAIFMLDPDGSIVSWSPGAERVKGYQTDEIVGQHLSRLYLAADVAEGKPQELLRRAADEGRATAEGWRVRKNGTRFWADIVSTSLRGENGTLLGFTHVVRDATERKRAEEEICTLNDELAMRVQELAAANDEILRRNRELDAVNAAITSISAALDLESVLQNIADAARSLVQCQYAALGVANEDGKLVRFITSGITEKQREAIGAPPWGHGLLGVLVREGKPLRLPDINSHPRRYGFPPNHPHMKSLLGVPISFQGNVVGDLYLTDKLDGSEFSQEDQDLLMLLANHAAVAIENAGLYEEVRAARDRLTIWNEELEAKVAERTLAIQQHSKELTTRVLAAQEEERKRIARELHDETAQSLSTLLINMDLLDPYVSRGDPVLQTGFERIRQLTRRTLDGTRALSHDLRPTILDDVGLAAALQWFADEFTKTFQLPVHVHFDEASPAARAATPALTPEQEIALFRIAQEALTNTGKYADATHAGLTLAMEDGTATLVVEDDGKGFEPDRLTGPTRQGGLGMYGMRERAELLGGTLAVDAAPGQGTRITVVIPLNPHVERSSRGR
jgi:PAS domain S-box-containing protein